MLSKTLLNTECLLIAVMVVGMLGQRFQLLPFKVAFGGFALALLLAAVVALVALIIVALSFGPLSSGQRPHAIMAFAIVFFPLLITLAIAGAGMKAPRIHNITTDLDNPVTFVKAGSLRGDSDNSIAPLTGKVAELHRSHYGHLTPIITDLAPLAAYERALDVAQTLGWEVTYRDPKALHFEALERTALFGFIDDVAVRVSSTDSGSKIDLRSVSRVGVSDLGANAKRIERFQEAFVK